MIQHFGILKFFIQLPNVNANDNDDFPQKKKKIGKCYMTLVAIKYFNILISNKPFLEQLIKKTNKKRMEILSKCQETNDYTSGNLLDYLYHQKYYKLIRIDL